MFALASVSPSFASVGIQVDGSLTGHATDINFVRGGTDYSDNGSTFNVPIVGDNMLAAGTANGGATSMATTDTAVPTTYAYVRKAIGPTVGHAGTLANGTPGQILTIFITSVSGSGTFVLTPTTKTGFTTLTFDAAKDQATLQYINSSVGWILIGNTSVTVAIP